MKASHADAVPSAALALARTELGEELEFMRLLWAVAHGMSSTSRVMEEAMGVTDLQRRVVWMASRFPGITASRLASVLHLHPSTLTGVVKRLVQRGHLLRQEDPLDMRRALLFVTESGRKLDVPDTYTVEGAVQRLFARISRETLSEARELLTALAEELHRADEEHGGEAPPSEMAKQAQ
jgi:MarR family transcriptional regulator, organic hydroperoxide resistance regulator